MGVSKIIPQRIILEIPGGRHAEPMNAYVISIGKVREQKSIAMLTEMCKPLNAMVNQLIVDSE